MVTIASVGKKSKDNFARARLVFPDGTSRVTVERDPEPLYIDCGEGSYLFDVDGRRFLDLNCNFTALIHGQCLRTRRRRANASAPARQLLRKSDRE
ncbi:glutamate-1-semialdehyde aminotransferase [Bradyrhizobium sp. JR3.5]